MPYPGESKIDWLKRLAWNVFDKAPEPPFFRGVLTTYTTITKIGRKTYPMCVHLKIKTGNDENRVSTVVEMTWDEVKFIHDSLGFALRDRAALLKKLEPYRGAFKP